MASDQIHPVQKDMINLGCRNQFSVGIAFQVYMDLCEVQAMQDVQYLYSHELDMLYLVGKTGRDSHSGSRSEIFLPLSSVSEITPAWIQKVQDTLCTDEDKKGITLAMKDHDSTVVYYRMTQGLVPPDSPETAHRKKQCDEQKHFIAMELRRMRHELLDRALKTVSSDKVRTYTSNEQETSNSGSTINAAAEEQVNTESAGDQAHMNSEATQDSTECEQ
jgi:hypothetical protein